MNIRFVVLIVIALAIAGITAYGVKNKLGSNPAPVGTKILAAASDIPAGSFVRADSHLAWIDWPANNLNPSFVVQGRDTIDQFNGAVARRSIMAGEPITGNVLVKSNEGGFLSAVLLPGKRAVSIAVNATSGNAGFIFPGDRVDLVLTHDIPSSGDGGHRSLAAETFVEDVRVLAIDQMLDNPENKAVLAKTVTLEVTPSQAEAINVAQGLGKISLTLRSLAADNAKQDGTMSDDVTEHRNYTRDSDVSKLLSKNNNINSRVSVTRGDQTETLEFHQEAQ